VIPILQSGLEVDPVQSLFVLAQFGGWVSVSEAAAGPQPRSKAAAEPQSKQQGARLARLYFLREKGLWATEAGIKIDGQSVGSVSKGMGQLRTSRRQLNGWSRSAPVRFWLPASASIWHVQDSAP